MLANVGPIECIAVAFVMLVFALLIVAILNGIKGLLD